MRSFICVLLLICLPLLCYSQYTNSDDYVPASTLPSGGSSQSVGSDAGDQSSFEDPLLNAFSQFSIQGKIQSLTQDTRLFGTPMQYTTAQYIESELKRYGFSSVEILNFTATFPRPVTKTLVITEGGNTDYQFQFKEPDIEGQASNPDSYDPFLTYSADGSATAEVIYVNYGRQSDYAVLTSQQISVANKIVIARLGYLELDQKVANAQKFQAAGLLLYADPADDGYTRGDVYPNGPYRPTSSSFSGQLKSNALCPGSGRSQHITDRCMQNVKWSLNPFPTIPVLPLSADDATNLLSPMTGSSGSSLGWQGGLPFQYHTGHGPTVTMTVASDPRDTFVNGYNVVGTLFDSKIDLQHSQTSDAFDPKTYVGIGAHRDSFSTGGLEAAGQATILEVASALGYLKKSKFWRPRRNIKVFSWDGAELGQVGSVYWVEQNTRVQSGINVSMVAYLDINRVMNSVPSPRNSRLVRWALSASGSLKSVVRAASAKVVNPIQNSATLNDSGYTFERPGRAQTDALAFWNYAGVPSMESSFIWNSTVANQYGINPGVWHSRWNDNAAVKGFYDPTSSFAMALGQVYGLVAYWLSTDLIVPLDYQGTYDQIVYDLGTIEPMLRASPVWNNDPRYSQQVQTAWTNINTAVSAFLTSVQAVRSEIDAWKAKEGVDPSGSIPLGDFRSIQTLNQRLVMTERMFLTTGFSGLRFRPWFKNTMFAVDWKNDTKTVGLPGVTDAFWEEDWDVLVQQMNEFTQRVKDATSYLRYGDSGPSIWQRTSTSVAVIVVVVIVVALIFLAICVILICCVVARKRNNAARSIN